MTSWRGRDLIRKITMLDSLKAMRPSHRTIVLTAGVVSCLIVAQPAPAQSSHRTHNVVLIVSDGLRWQEVFQGAERDLMNRQYGHVQDTIALRRTFLRDNPDSARAVLFPFLWHVVAKQGEIFGNRNKQSDADVTNGFKFSYPGYSEMLTGHPDPRIHSNNAGPNPSVTVFEWLNDRAPFTGSVAAFGTWNEFADIFNRERSHLPIWAGWDLPPTATPATSRDSLLTNIYATTTRIWDDLAYDSFMQAEVQNYIAWRHPRVLFVGYGETDEWAHMGRYDKVLESAHQFDQFVGDLWDAVQRMPQYRDSTTFIITTDHGRGSGLEQWTDHGADIAGAESIWIAIMGPDTPALGERTHTAHVTQSQIAATVAELLGQDYNAAVPSAARALPVH